MIGRDSKDPGQADPGVNIAPEYDTVGFRRVGADPTWGSAVPSDESAASGVRNSGEFRNN